MTVTISNWDFDNRLNTADVGNNGSADATYKFDAMGRRVFRDDGTTASVYVQAGQQTIADYTAGTAATSPTHRYVYASYIDEPVLRYKPSASESLYYHRNQQYSVVALTNASAATVERYAYSAYGVPTITNASGTVLPLGTVNNRYMYTGREWDSVIAQYHYRARMYDANLGRFASRDPMSHMQYTNLYQSVGSMPLDGIDPTGMLTVLDTPAKPWKCAMAVSVMMSYATFTPFSRYEYLLMDHYMYGGGSDLTLPMDAFDSTGANRAFLASMVLWSAKIDFKKIPCNTSQNFTSGPTADFVYSSRTRMINKYKLSAYGVFKATKTCPCESCTIDYLFQFKAKDRTDFNPGEQFCGLYMCITDQLIIDCNLGSAFNVSSNSINRGRLNGCDTSKMEIGVKDITDIDFSPPPMGYPIF